MLGCGGHGRRGPDYRRQIVIQCVARFHRAPATLLDHLKQNRLAGYSAHDQWPRPAPVLPPQSLVDCGDEHQGAVAYRLTLELLHLGMMARVPRLQILFNNLVDNAPITIHNAQ